MLGPLPRYPFDGLYHDDGYVGVLRADRVNSFADGPCFVYFGSAYGIGTNAITINLAAVAYVFVAHLVDPGFVLREFLVDDTGGLFRVYFAADLIAFADGDVGLLRAACGRRPAPALQPGLFSGPLHAEGQSSGESSAGQRRVRAEFCTSGPASTGRL